MSIGVMFFNPYTGQPRHPSDIKSDPRGVLIWDGEEPLKASKADTPPLPVQEPVQFLAGGTRFKLSLDDEGKVNCFGHWKELDGRWVALVAAEDDCHLTLTAAQPVQPAQEPDCQATGVCVRSGLYAAPQPEQEPVARVTGVYGGRFTYEPINPAMILPVGMALYAAPKGKT